MLKKLITVAAIGALVVASNASAREWCSCGKDLNRFFDKFTGAVMASITAITAGANGLVPAMTAATAQLTGEMEKKTEALTKTAEADIAWQAQKDFQYKAADIKRDQAPPVSCCSGLSTQGLNKSSKGATASAADLTRVLSKRSLEGMSPQKALTEMYQAHVKDYCSTIDVEQKRCLKEADDGLGGADVMASTLYQPSDGQMYGEKEAAAARIFITNVVDPLPPPSLEPQALATPQGRTFQELMNSRAAALSLSTYSLSRIYGARLTPEKTQ